MNKVNSEQIFDSFLSEFLEDSKPITISINDLQSHPVDGDSALRFDAASDEAHHGWLTAIEASTKPSGAHSVGSIGRRSVKSSQHPRRTNRRTPSFWSKTKYLLSGVAAGALLAFGSWGVWSKSFSPDSSLASAEADKEASASSDSKTNLAIAEENQPNEKVDSVETILASEGSDKPGNSELLPMDSVPFSSRGAEALLATERSSISESLKKPQILDTPVVLNSDDLVTLVEDQMDYMWKLRGVSPTPAIADEQWIQRASLLVTGKPMSSEGQDEFLANKSETRRQDWLDRATASDDFYKYWTNKFSNAILPKPESSESTDSIADRTRFRTWLLSRLQASIPLDEIVQEILVAQGTLATTASDYSPQAYWWAQVAANDDHSRATNAITSNLLGQRGSCIRCHDSTAGVAQNSTNASTNKDARVSSSVSRDDYWNLASVVSGINVSARKTGSDDKLSKSQTTGANPVDESTNRIVGYSEDWHPLFYERSDRSLMAAKSKLPNGLELAAPSEKRPTSKEAIRGNIEQLATWLTSTPAFDQRQVNWVWESMLGQPLENRYLTVDSEGLVEKQELLEALGAQLRSSKFDLGKLVKALALTNAFERESQACDPVWYITSTPQELAEYQQRQRMFASFPATMDPSFRSLKNVATWFRRSHSLVLGQASYEQLKAPKSKDNSKPDNAFPEVTAAQTQFIVRSRVLPKGLVAEVEQWLSSSMPWEELVDHAFYLADDAPATKLEQMSARDLLNSTRDRRQAIQRILASRLP